jgi:hypothetical protein
VWLPHAALNYLMNMSNRAIIYCVCRFIALSHNLFYLRAAILFGAFNIGRQPIETLLLLLSALVSHANFFSRFQFKKLIARH